VRQLSIGVIAESRKPDELRLGIHPSHIERIAPELRRNLLLQRGYGERYGIPDEQLGPLVGGLRERDQLLAESDVVLLPKPLAADLESLRAGQVVWGWVHAVQDRELTQHAIDRGLTLIAWEAMNRWTPDGAFSTHVFHRNNELAGYCSVLHALQLLGLTGQYGRRLRAAVISFGATARGAVTALEALGIDDVTVLTQRSPASVSQPFPAVRMRGFARDPADGRRTIALDGAQSAPLAHILARHDIVVNCILQDTDEPLMFVLEDELDRFAPGSLIVDVSCDEGMGFEWARPTSFAAPMFTVGDGVHYYAVDHTPSFLWNSATWENSEALLGYLATVAGGPDAWERDETIRRAIEIRDGRILNPRILSFQNRSPEPPYAHRNE
jgi:alanine dehydrogenase